MRAQSRTDPSRASPAGPESDRDAAPAEARTAALVERLARYDRLVEVGIGRRTAVAARLAERGRSVIAADVRERPAPDGVEFVRDDVTDPDPTVYAGADAVYARNCPPELQRPARTAAAIPGAPFLFTTLGGDPAVVPARPERAGDDTLFVAEPPRSTYER